MTLVPNPKYGDELGTCHRPRAKLSPARLKRGMISLGWRKTKWLYQISYQRRYGDKQVLFILGCQRSGTTMMTEILDADLDANVYPEHSRLSSNDRHRLRLNALDKVKESIDESPFPLIVLKPLVESQNGRELLDYFPNSKALWMYRHYRDVARSSVNRFGPKNDVRNLRYIAINAEQNWRAEKVSTTVRSIVARHFNENMDPHDAAALYWYVRNSHFFGLALDTDPRVTLCKYESLATDPRREVERIYEFLGRNMPRRSLGLKIHNDSIGGGATISLSREIERLCEALWIRLNQADLPADPVYGCGQ